MEENKDNEQLEEEQVAFSYQDTVSNILKNMQVTNQALANIGEQVRQMQQAFISPELKETLSNFGKVGSALVAAVNSDAIKSFGEMALRMQSYKIDIPKFDCELP